MPDHPGGRAARLCAEQGLTVVELSTTMALVLILFALVVPVVGSAWRSVGDVSERAETNSQATLALTQVERDVRSGNVIAAPGPVDDVEGMEVRIYTQANGDLRCVQYRVAGERLERRTRAPGLGGAWPDVWSVVTEGVENAAQSPPLPAFTRSADRQMLTIDLMVNRNRPGKGVRLTSSVTGRNTKYYDTPFAEEKCD